MYPNPDAGLVKLVPMDQELSFGGPWTPIHEKHVKVAFGLMS